MNIDKIEIVVPSVVETPRAEPVGEDEIGFSRQMRDIYSHPVLAKGEDKRLFRPITEALSLHNSISRSKLKKLVEADRVGVEDKVQVLLEALLEDAEVEATPASLRKSVKAVTHVLKAKESKGDPEDHIQETLHETFTEHALSINQAAIKEVSPAIMQTLIDEADDQNILVDNTQVELLRQKSSQAEAAKVRLLEGVQQYVVKVAKAFQGRGVPLEDLIQEGNLGVLKAIEKFQPEKGYAFLTYADDWIRQRMSRACTDKGSLEKYHMRMPCHMYMAIGRVQKHYPLLHDELGREPYPDELAERAEISSSQAEMALKVLSRSTVSLDAHWTNDDSDVSVGEAIADNQAIDPLREITEGERKAQVWKAFEQLPAEEQQVLFMRLGLGDDGRKYTQEQVCAALDIKKSKLVTIQRRASNKLKVAPELQELADEILSKLDD